MRNLLEGVRSEVVVLAGTVARALVMFLGLIAAFSPAAANIYDIDPDHTEVRFTWDHLGLSRQGGRFTEISGTLHFDPASPAASQVEARIPLKSIMTGVRKLDEHLISSREFFDASAHPDIVFMSTLVEPTGGRTARVTGNLTMNGVTRPVVLDVTWNFSGEHPLAAINPTFAGIYVSGFSATTQLRRSDWGLTRTIPWVSDEILISIETELHRRPVAPVEDRGMSPSAGPDLGAGVIPSAVPEGLAVPQNPSGIVEHHEPGAALEAPRSSLPAEGALRPAPVDVEPLAPPAEGITAAQPDLGEIERRPDR